MRRVLQRADPRSDGLPIPPLAMRELVGPTDPAAFDNPTGDLVYPHLPEEAYESVFDFGCGCGRVARQLMQQHARPRRYVGIDLHRGMVKWCQTNLAPHADGFEFRHHNVFNYQFNPGRSKPDVLSLPAPDSSATFINAWSVFTHLTQHQAEFYLSEVSRVLASAGFFQSTWFLIDKALFPMLQPQTSALYVDYINPGAAVLFDKGWVIETARNVGLVVTQTIPPAVRGYQWVLVMRRNSGDVEEVGLPEDTAPVGKVPAEMRAEATASGSSDRFGCRAVAS